MPYQRLDSGANTLNDTAAIWRYTDFAKFVSLVTTRSLFFAQVARLDDPFEGSLTRAVYNHQNMIDSAPAGVTFTGGIQIVKPAGALVITPEESSANRRTLREYMYANCWHANERESVAMWQLYAPSGFGIAVQSTIARLAETLSPYNEPVYVGEVEYIDFETHDDLNANLFTPYLRKRKSFEHEREIRAIIENFGKIAWTHGIGTYTPNPVFGVYVPVDLERLIERVYVSPEAPQWYADAVRNVLGLVGKAPDLVHQSALDSKPLI